MTAAVVEHLGDGADPATPREVGDRAIEAPDRGPGPLARRRRRSWLVLVVAFALTRALAAFVADHPSLYGTDRADGTTDVHLYDRYSWEIRHTGAQVYDDLAMEYPPGALPFMLVPRYLSIASYRSEFIGEMVAIDALGLWALWRLSTRRTSTRRPRRPLAVRAWLRAQPRVGWRPWSGPADGADAAELGPRWWWGLAAWIVLLPALGPIAYTRLDLVVAVTLVGVVERTHAGRWGTAGALLGFGAAVKLVPVLLVPIVLLVAPKGARGRVLVGAGGVGLVWLVPFLPQFTALVDSVAGYHLERGVHLESLWGVGLLLVGRAGWSTVTIVQAYGAYDVRSSGSAAVKQVANAVALVTFGLVSAMGRRTARGDVARLAVLLLAALTLYVGLGRVYSPQYVTWLVGLAAAAVALAPRVCAGPLLALAGVVALSHLEFPYLFFELVDDAGLPVLTVVALRDLLTLATGGLALVAWRRLGQPRAAS